MIYRDNYRFYLNLGLIPYPASKADKQPVVKWQTEFPNPVESDYLRWAKEHADKNIWCKLGSRFVVVDPDSVAAENFVKNLNLPKCPMSISGRKSVHRWFKVDTPLRPLKISVGNLSIEVRTGEQGMLCTPSVHPDTGISYRWADGLSPKDVLFPIFPMYAYEKIKSLIPKPSFKDKEKPINKGVSSSFDIEAYLRFYGVNFRIKYDAGRTFYLLQRCLFAGEHTTKDVAGDSSIVQGASGLLTYQCFHSHCAFKTWADARSVISGNDNLAQFCSGEYHMDDKPKKVYRRYDEDEDIPEPNPPGFIRMLIDGRIR